MTPGQIREAKKKEKREARKALRASTTKKQRGSSHPFGAFFELAKDFRFSLAHLQKKK
jgi:hypothetical protein